MKNILCIILAILFSMAFTRMPYQVRLEGKYLGQPLPGDIPVLFAKGIVSTDSIEHSAPAFSPDGKRVLWTVINRPQPAFILESRFENGVWTVPTKTSFSSADADDFYPSFSIDGKTLLFSSRRKSPPGYPVNKDMGIWKVERKGNDWGAPMPFDTTVSTGVEYAHSISRNGTIYFSFRKDGGRTFDIACAKKQGDHYLPIEILPAGINSTSYEDGPYIAPDESYLIFESGRPGGVENSIDLYISFKKKDKKWSAPLNMGSKINTKSAERFGKVSPDGKYFFFGSNRDGIFFDIFWMDAGIIKELRKDAGPGI
jgi:Tol biopolymer transport system component